MLGSRGRSCHGGLGGFWLSHPAISECANLSKFQLPFHVFITRTMYASKGPLLFHALPFGTGFCTCTGRNESTVQCLRLRQVPPEFEGAQRRVFQAVAMGACVQCLAKDSVNIAQKCSIHGSFGHREYSVLIRFFRVSCGLACCLGFGRARCFQSTSDSAPLFCYTKSFHNQPFSVWWGRAPDFAVVARGSDERCSKRDSS